MKILHLAPFNVAGVPIEFVRAERSLGFTSRLVTLGRSRLQFEEDICLDLPLLDSPVVNLAKRLFSPATRTQVHYRVPPATEIPRIWHPNRLENGLIVAREFLWRPKIQAAMQQYHLEDFDIYQLDGGLEFFRDGRFIRALKARGKKIICCYTGSDLRVRGILPAIDALSDLNISVEFDHQFLHPNLTHVPFPINPERYTQKASQPGEKIRIGHAPTNRQAKGSDLIIPIVRQLEDEFPVELILIERLPYPQALALKATCQIFIDQIGDLGYGISALEALCMGIPTCTCLAPGFDAKYPDHPFVVVDEQNLRPELIHLIQDTTFREVKARAGFNWVWKVHDSRAVVQRIHALAGMAK
ncbi:hypothetical protein L0128_03220 [candidate division KSB1 bacterium]|nr:hypothetical protein [candidate division KSB1 bacterium]